MGIGTRSKIVFRDPGCPHIFDSEEAVALWQARERELRRAVAADADKLNALLANRQSMLKELPTLLKRAEAKAKIARRGQNELI